MRIKVKICGVKEPDNIREIAALRPDYIGIVRYPKSPRFCSGPVPLLPRGVKSVGVFVNSEVLEVEQAIFDLGLEMVQLHGDESPQYCSELLRAVPQVSLVKAFSVDETFDFSVTETFRACEFFLFDAKGKLPGGNGVVFPWHILERYGGRTPYFLSGGLGVNNLAALKALAVKQQRLYGFDFNSGVEECPGKKSIAAVKKVLSELGDEYFN